MATTDARSIATAGGPPTMAAPHLHDPDDRYKWVALSNTTLGVLMATIDGSIVLIALPDIFRGIGIDPLLPANTFYLLWMILGFLIVTAVLVVSLGRLGDMYGRVRTYNLGFAIFTFFSLMLSITWMTGTAAALYLVILRIFQAVGAACLIANSSAILTDAFPENQRGMALGINQVAGISGTFIGLVLGGLLAPINWRLIFLVTVPIGAFATVWSYKKLREVPRHVHGKIDWPGNITFAIGLIALMVGITYGIQPYGGHVMGWTSPFVIGSICTGLVFLVAFAIIETKVADPMFRLGLFRIRAFTAGSVATLLAGIGRGGLMFMLIIWLQGIWLPLHGYDFARTPAVGRHLHAAHDGGLPDGRPHLGLPLGPLRVATVRHRRHADGRPHLLPARDAAGRLQLRDFRRPLVLERPVDGLPSPPPTGPAS